MRETLLIVVIAAVAVSACRGTADTVTTVLPTTPASGGAVMELTSPAFDPEGRIPDRFTCKGNDDSPELRLAGVPQEAVTLALIMDDPDAPGGTWDHWVAFDITPTGVIPENVGELGTGGLNSWKRSGYGGPCPPPGVHRYYFRVYALDTSLGLAEGSTKDAVLSAATGHTLEVATLMGTFGT
jgi:Raf kinase inhibitor-like YbhB/YbcL family protein